MNIPHQSSKFPKEMRDYLDQIIDQMESKGHSMDGLCKACGNLDYAHELMERISERSLTKHHHG